VLENARTKPPLDLVVLGASAGGVRALSDVVRALPADFPAAVLIVLHVAPSSASMLPQILDRASVLPVAAARDGEHIEAGHVYVAPPDLHLVVEDGSLRLNADARVNGHRPAIDPLFCSAAELHHEHVTGVVLSGTRDDGTVGLAQIKACGGVAIVQDPDDADFTGMPVSAIEHVAVDAILPAGQIADALVRRLAGEPLPGGTPAAIAVTSEPQGSLLTTVCPECGGVLTEQLDDGVPVWRCNVGHQFGSRTLAELQGSNVEQALWTAVRTLEDRRALLERLAGRAETRANVRSARSYRDQADMTNRQTDRIRLTIHELATSAGVSVAQMADDESVA
jgi:two-component system chemotaxis response regulator CheB